MLKRKNGNRFKRTFRKKKPLVVKDRAGYKNFRAVKSYGLKPDPFPRMLFSRHKWADYYNITTSGVALDLATERVFSLSNLFDPNSSGTGLSIKGYANMKALYFRYIVMGVKMIVEFNNVSSDGITCGVSLNQNDATTNEGFEYVARKTLTYLGNLNNTGSQKKIFKFYIKPDRLVINNYDKRSYLSNPDNWGNYQTDTGPVNNVILRVWALSQSTLSAQVNFNIKLIYYVKSFDRTSIL